MSGKVEGFLNVSQYKSPATDPRPGISLLFGPLSCVKTSLLFQFSSNLAASKGESQRPIVLFICWRRRLEAKPPYLLQGIDPSSDVFRQIQMKYVDDDDWLRKYFAAFHLLETVSTSVIVDDFEELFDERSCQQKYANHRGWDMAMVRTLALCRNAISHAK